MQHKSKDIKSTNKYKKIQITVYYIVYEYIWLYNQIHIICNKSSILCIVSKSIIIHTISMLPNIHIKHQIHTS